MKDILFLVRSCSSFQIPIYPKAVPIPDPRQLLSNIIYIKPSFFPNQRYKSVPYKLLPIHISNTTSIKKYYPIKAITRNKPTCSNNYSQKHIYSKSLFNHSPYTMYRMELLSYESCQLNISFRSVSKMSIQGNLIGQIGQSQLDQILALVFRNLGSRTMNNIIRYSDLPKTNLQYIIKWLLSWISKLYQTKQHIKELFLIFKPISKYRNLWINRYRPNSKTYTEYISIIYNLT